MSVFKSRGRIPNCLTNTTTVCNLFFVISENEFSIQMHFADSTRSTVILRVYPENKWSDIRMKSLSLMYQVKCSTEVHFYRSCPLQYFYSTRLSLCCFYGRCTTCLFFVSVFLCSTLSFYKCTANFYGNTVCFRTRNFFYTNH